MAQVEQHFLRLDPLDCRAPELRQSAIIGLERPISAQVAVIVGQLDGHDAVLLHLRQTVECRPDHRGVLRAEQHGELLLALGFQDVAGAANKQQAVGIGRDEILLSIDALQIVAPGIGDVSNRKHGIAHHGHAGRLGLRPCPLAQPQHIVRAIRIADAAKCIDYDGAIIPPARSTLAECRPRNGGCRGTQDQCPSTDLHIAPPDLMRVAPVFA
jgi:hypothetical protein